MFNKNNAKRAVLALALVSMSLTAGSFRIETSSVSDRSRLDIPFIKVTNDSRIVRFILSNLVFGGVGAIAGAVACSYLVAKCKVDLKGDSDNVRKALLFSGGCCGLYAASKFNSNAVSGVSARLVELSTRVNLLLVFKSKMNELPSKSDVIYVKALINALWVSKLNVAQIQALKESIVLFEQLLAPVAAFGAEVVDAESAVDAAAEHAA